MVMNLVLFSWFITTEYFYHLTDTQVKDLLYAEQQKMIEDDILPEEFLVQNQVTPPLLTVKVNDGIQRIWRMK